MSHKEWTRRELLKLGLGTVATSAAIEGLGHMLHVPGWHKLLGGSHLPHPDWAVRDSFELTRLLGQAGSPGQLAALFQLQEAFAQDANADNEWTLITIKVFDQVFHPLVFAMGEIDAGTGEVKTANLTDHFAVRKTSAASRTHLLNEGVNKLCTDARMKNLRLNNWFGQRLLNGTYDGKSNGEKFNYGNYVKPFPSNVALQMGIGVQPMDPGIAVHRLYLGKMRSNLCDLAHLAAMKGLVNSPLGITCLMMGEQYDSNGSELFNVVYSGLSSADNAKFVVSGKALSPIVQNIDQSLKEGFTDTRAINSGNLTYLLDKLAISNPQRRAALIESRSALTTTISNLKTISSNELKPLLAMDDALANKQAFFNGSAYETVAAKHEFLSHCAFVAEAMKIQGRPYRNFSLFLNLNDLDGSNIDEPKNGSVSFKANSLNYVEGMRQLAMGLNILGNAISGKKALVMVVSDGGRDSGMGDGSGPAFAMLLGPGADLADQLYAPFGVVGEAVSSSDDANTKFGNFGNRTTGLAWTGASSGATWGLRTSAGVASSAQTNMGDWQAGVFHFLCEKRNRLDLMSPDLGSYVLFKRT